MSSSPYVFVVPGPESSSSGSWYQTTASNVAAAVLSSCGVDTTADTTSVGGSLAGVDLKNVDAASALKMSLMEEYADSGIWYDPVVLPNGKLSLIDVGSEVSNINDFIYFSIDNSDLMPGPDISVEIHGKKSEPERSVGTYQNLLLNAKLWDTSAMMTGCTLAHTKQYATITFKDPQLDSESTLGDLGATVWDRTLGWTYILDPHLPVDVLPSVTVKVSETSVVPLLLSGNTNISSTPVEADTGVYMGKLQIPEYNPLAAAHPECFQGSGTSVTCGKDSVTLIMPPELRYTTRRSTLIDNYKGISKVYILGHFLDRCESIIQFNTDGTVPDVTSKSSWLPWVKMDDMEPKLFKLEEGTDYVVAYDTIKAEACIQFINNYPDICSTEWGTSIKYFIRPGCKFADNGAKTSGTGVLFPRGDRSGYLVRQVWAEVNFDSPSITVYDPSGDAVSIASNVTYEAAPIFLYDEPAPVVIDGVVIDLSSYVQDNNPTTAQDLENSAYNTALQALDGRQLITLSMSTLNEDTCITLCNSLKTLANSNRGLNVTHICGPEATPKLGQTIGSGVINAISYSYTDEGSYTISVTEGPIFMGNTSSISGDAYTLKTATESGPGIVVGARDYHGALYDVLIQGIGVRTAINGQPQILQVGDHISVTLYNNPVER